MNAPATQLDPKTGPGWTTCYVCGEGLVNTPNFFPTCRGCRPGTKTWADWYQSSGRRTTFGDLTLKDMGRRKAKEDQQWARLRAAKAEKAGQAQADEAQIWAE